MRLLRNGFLVRCGTHEIGSSNFSGKVECDTWTDSTTSDPAIAIPTPANAINSGKVFISEGGVWREFKPESGVSISAKLSGSSSVGYRFIRGENGEVVIVWEDESVTVGM